MSAKPNRAASVDDRDLRADSLVGAFIEGVDLGPRGSQIRELGQSIEFLVQALRWELARMRLSERFPRLEEQIDAVARAARIARSYVADRGDTALNTESTSERRR